MSEAPAGAGFQGSSSDQESEAEEEEYEDSGHSDAAPAVQEQLELEEEPRAGSKSPVGSSAVDDLEEKSTPCRSLRRSSRSRGLGADGRCGTRIGLAEG